MAFLHSALSVDGAIGIPENTTELPNTSSALLNIPRVELTAVANVLVVPLETLNSPVTLRCVPVAFTKVVAPCRSVVPVAVKVPPTVNPPKKFTEVVVWLPLFVTV